MDFHIVLYDTRKIYFKQIKMLIAYCDGMTLFFLDEDILYINRKIHNKTFLHGASMSTIKSSTILSECDPNSIHLPKLRKVKYVIELNQ